MAEPLTVHYFAAARLAAGVESEQLPAASAVADALAEMVRRHGRDLERVLARCSFLLDGVAARAHTPVAGAARLDVLPPFAGG